MKKTYEAPKMTEIGGVADVTHTIYGRGRGRGKTICDYVPHLCGPPPTPPRRHTGPCLNS